MMRIVRTAVSLLLGIFVVSTLACGGGSSSHPTPRPTQPPSATATAELTATATLSTTPTATPSYSVKIYQIVYRGDVLRGEPDEYVVIMNYGDVDVNIYGWVLKDITDGYPSFTFPQFILGRGEMIRVYTKEYDTDWGGFRFNVDEGVWNNSHPDVAALYDRFGNLVSEATYEIE
jgi:hypothetical protein